MCRTSWGSSCCAAVPSRGGSSGDVWECWWAVWSGSREQADLLTTTCSGMTIASRRTSCRSSPTSCATPTCAARAPSPSLRRPTMHTWWPSEPGTTWWIKSTIGEFSLAFLQSCKAVGLLILGSVVSSAVRGWICPPHWILLLKQSRRCCCRCCFLFQNLGGALRVVNVWPFCSEETNDQKHVQGETG